MRSRSLLLALATVILVPALTRAQDTQPLQLRSTFQFDLPIPPSQAAPFFGPEGERCWAGGHWDPHFVFPQPAHDQQDAVFTIAHGDFKMIWVNTVFDLRSGHMQYVTFVADALVSTIDVRLTAAPRGTHVDVTYLRTALSAAANVHIHDLAEHDRNAGAEWAHEIQSCFQPGAAPSGPAH